ncbi:hypothetical protein DFP72DRAFT_1060822 [Ephemerocybe angulata]|uniref:SET domain-containing protein n=1 Tax=Ephemerocybe angulata TaxID=980116 RepID=A0A8H6IDP1_9AGAR|nr:hypothetical protein DFP72DRAFT_1060822 [Tulosesus angulatus]
MSYLIPNSFLEANAVLKQSAIIATIPSKGSQSCQMVTTPRTKAFILQQPNISLPTPTTIPIKYAVRVTAGMGKGLFATVDIPFAETFLVEKPLVVLPKNIGEAFMIPRSGLTPAAWHEACMDEGEKILQRALDRMTEEDRKTFEALCDISMEDAAKRPLISRLVSNAMNLQMDDPSGLNFGNGYVGIPRAGARINHSCTANAVFHFDPETFNISYTAMRDIKAGHQIFLSYVGGGGTCTRRKQAMTRYNFVCSCSACTDATQETDKLRLEFRPRIESLAGPSAKVQSVAQAKALLGSTIQLKKALEKEGLDNEPHFMNVWFALQALYMKTGDVGNAELCGKRAAAYLTFPAARAQFKKLSFTVVT